MAPPAAAGLLMLAACADGGTLPPGGTPGAAPRVTGTSAPVLVAGGTVTLSGTNFHAVPDSNTVRIGGARATVTGGGATSLDVVVPCLPPGPATVQVERRGAAGVPVPLAIQVPRRTLAVGEALVLSRRGEAECNELAPSGGDARYVLAVYNTSTDPADAAGFQLSAGGGVDAGPVQALAPAAAGAFPPAAAQGAEDRHLRILEMNRREQARLRAHFAGDARMAPRGSTAAATAGPPPLTRTIRVVDVFGGTCDRFYTVSATRVYYDGRIAIYEDDATAGWLKAAANPRMQAYYDAIGDLYNAELEPLVRNHFGDPLLRDASTDADGVLVALFTPLLNTAFQGVPAFVVSCDFYPQGRGNAGSNFGEYVYAFQPTLNAAGYNGLTPERWYWIMRSGLAHETKHVASLAARAAAGADLPGPWLEEGTARHAEELWARNAVYNVAWKANTGYGSAAAPGSIYCDRRWSDPACLATDPDRPTMAMYPVFAELNAFLRNPAAASPFGPTASGAPFASTSWSLVRYAIDRYGASDAGFLRALTASTAGDTDNLAARAGVSIEELMGGWALALYADDFPGLAGPAPALRMPTWNFRDIYAGLHGELGTTFPTPYPLAPHPLPFGAFGTVEVPAVAGGGVAYFELSGTHAQAQLLRLRGSGGGRLSPNLRLAIARLQ